MPFSTDFVFVREIDFDEYNSKKVFFAFVDALRFILTLSEVAMLNMMNTNSKYFDELSKTLVDYAYVVVLVCEVIFIINKVRIIFYAPDKGRLVDEERIFYGKSMGYLKFLTSFIALPLLIFFACRVGNIWIIGTCDPEYISVLLISGFIFGLQLFWVFYPLIVSLFRKTTTPAQVTPEVDVECSPAPTSAVPTSPVPTSPVPTSSGVVDEAETTVEPKSSTKSAQDASSPVYTSETTEEPETSSKSVQATSSPPSYSSENVDSENVTPPLPKTQTRGLLAKVTLVAKSEVDFPNWAQMPHVGHSPSEEKVLEPNETEQSTAVSRIGRTQTPEKDSNDSEEAGSSSAEKVPEESTKPEIKHHAHSD